MAMRFGRLHLAGIFVLAMACTAVTATAEGVVKVALVLARTGPAAVSDISGWPAGQLAVEDINREGGMLGLPLEVIALDTQSTPLGAKKAARTAVRSNVMAVIGAGWSSQSISMARVLQGAGIPMVTPSATHPDVTRVGNFIFRVCFTDIFQGRALAKFARNDLLAASAVVLRNVSESYSMNLAQEFSATYRALGGEVLWQGDYKVNAADFREMLERVNNLQPQVVFLPGYEQDCGKLMRQAAAVGLKIPFLGGDGWGSDILRVAGEAANGSYYLNHWHPEVPSDESRKLVKAFRKRFPEADYHSLMLPLTYDAFRLLADAVRRAGTLDCEKIRASLARTENYQGVTGPLTFDTNGDPVSRTATILKFSEEKTLFYKYIRFP